MNDTYKIHKVLCEGIDNKKKEYVRKVLDTMCKVSTKEKKIDTPIKKTEKGGPTIFMLNDKMSEEIKCDINKAGEIQDTIEEMKTLKDIEELMRCK